MRATRAPGRDTNRRSPMASATYFHYTDTGMRRRLAVAIAAIMVVLGFFCADICASLHAYYPYHRALTLGLLGALGCLLAGLAIGSRFYAIGGRRGPFRILAVLIAAITAAGIIATVLTAPERDLRAELLLISSFFLVPLVGLLPFLAGMYIAYPLKLACGDFIDGQSALAPFVLALFAGLAAGVAMFVASCYVDALRVLPLVAIAASAPFVFAINLDFSPSAVTTDESAPPPQSSHFPGPDALERAITLTRYAVPLALAVLGYVSLQRFFGDTFHISAAIIGFALAAVPAGFAAAHLLRRLPWRNFVEPLAPIAFLLPLYAQALYAHISFTAATLLYAPVMIIFGFSLYSALESLRAQYAHGRRFGVVIAYAAVVPIALFALAAFAPLVNAAYVAIVACASLMLVAAATAAGLSRATTVHQRIAHAALAPALIAAFVLLLAGSRFPLTRDQFAPTLTNVSSICPIQFTADVLRETAEVRLGRARIYRMSDPVYRNLRRAFAPIHLHTGGVPGRHLVIDGNLQFYASPVPLYPAGAGILDPIPEGFVARHTMSCAPVAMIGTTREDILYFFHKRRMQYAVIIDIPNPYELTFLPFRFSPAYARLIKRSLAPGGYFAQVLDVTSARAELAAAALRNFTGHFAAVEGYLFGGHLVLLGSDRPGAFAVTEERVQALAAALTDRPELRGLFMSELHPLAHRLYVTARPTLAGIPRLRPHHYLLRIAPVDCESPLVSGAAPVGPDAADHALREIENAKLRTALAADLAKNRDIYRFIRAADCAAVAEDHAAEIAALADLKKIAAGRPDARDFIERTLAAKERYYYHSGISYESRQQWQEARRRFEIALAINEGNFDANYRLGSLCITVQDFEAALKHLQQAMKLKADNPDVLYQMGVLQFFDYNPQGALEYFKKALSLGMRSVPVYINIGLCYEELDQYYDARVYYQEALKIDPKDKNVLASLERLSAKMDKQKEAWGSSERRNQQEEEIEEEIPLPINKSAYDKRLSDDQAKQLDPPDDEKPGAPKKPN